MRSQALLRAIEAAGGAAELARKLGIRSQSISGWERVPAERVIEVEKATDGQVSRHEIRPDLYPRDGHQNAKHRRPSSSAAA